MTHCSSSEILGKAVLNLSASIIPKAGIYPVHDDLVEAIEIGSFLQAQRAIYFAGQTNGQARVYDIFMNIRKTQTFTRPISDETLLNKILLVMLLIGSVQVQVPKGNL